MMLSDEQATKLRKMIEVFQEVAGIASSYSHCIDSVADHGGEDSDDPIERIHWLCYHTDHDIDLDEQSSQQVQDEPVQDKKLDELFESVIRWGEEHTGNEPSISCFHRAVDELRDHVKAMPTPKQEPVTEVFKTLMRDICEAEATDSDRSVHVDYDWLYSRIEQAFSSMLPQAAAIPEGCMLVPIEPHRGDRYDAGLWSMRNWNAAMADQGK